MNMPSIAKITDLVWIQTSFIGDIILTTAAAAKAATLMPHARQHLITTVAGAAALSASPLFASINVFDKRQEAMASAQKLRHALKSKVGDHPVILQPHKSLRSTMLAMLLPGPVITYYETSGSLLAAKRVPRVSVFHESDRISLLLEGLGFSRAQVTGHRPVLSRANLQGNTNLAISLSSMSETTRWIGVAPGSMWGTKRWPTPKFTSLCQMMLDHPSVGIVLLGSEDEARLCNEIEEGCLRTRPHVRERLVNLSGKTKLSELTAIYPRLSLVVANDSSPIHYASAFNIPTVAIFGSTTSELGFAPLSDQKIVVEKNLDCRPCSDHGPQTCPLGHFKCMNEISVDDVKSAFQKLMNL